MLDQKGRERSLQSLLKICCETKLPVGLVLADNPVVALNFDTLVISLTAFCTDCQLHRVNYVCR